MSFSYSLIRSKRRTLAIQVDATGALIVRSPLRTPLSTIEGFLREKSDWIEKHQQKRRNAIPKTILTPSEIRLAKESLRRVIVPRTYALWEGKNLPKITSIKITKSEKRWGSCSGKNGLCFSYRLAPFLDTDLLDAIILHELAHLREKNHLKPFWTLLYGWMPDYDTKIRMLQGK